MPSKTKTKNRNMILSRLIAGLALFLIFISTLSIDSQAQLSADNFEVKAVSQNNLPWFVENVQPGSTLFREIEVSNLAETARNFAIYAGDSFQLDDGSLNFNQKDQQNSGPGTWIDIKEKELIMEGKRSSRSGFEIKIPEDVKPGQYMAVVAAEPFSNEEKSGFELSTRIGVRVYFNVGSQLSFFQSQEIIEAGFVTPETPMLDTFLQTLKSNPTKKHIYIVIKNNSNSFSRAEMVLDNINSEKNNSTTYSYEVHPDKDQITVLIPLDEELEVGESSIDINWKYSDLIKFVEFSQNSNLNLDVKTSTKRISYTFDENNIKDLKSKISGFIRSEGVVEQAVFGGFVVNDDTQEAGIMEGYYPVSYIATIISFTSFIVLVVYFITEYFSKPKQKSK
jgi:hypothetical protein